MFGNFVFSADFSKETLHKRDKVLSVLSGQRSLLSAQPTSQCRSDGWTCSCNHSGKARTICMHAKKENKTVLFDSWGRVTMVA